MELKHTKGEWDCELLSKSYLYQVTAKNKEGQIVVPNTKESIANANLIAASPTMLEALIAVEKTFNAFTPQEVIDKVNNAIEKATANN